MNLYLHGFTPCDDALAVLLQAGVVATCWEQSADALWVRFDMPDLGKFPHLRYILCAATGTEHINAPPGVRVLSLRDVPPSELDKVTATAELTIGLMLNMLRQIGRAVHDVAHATDCLGYPESGTDYVRREYYIGNDLRGKRVLVVGLGRVGWQVRRLLLAFGCAVEAFDPRLNSGTLDEMLPRADIVTVHASLNESSVGMFDARRFDLMKPGAWFVNTARGQLVVSDALAAALDSGHLAGAAVDFWDGSRLPRNLLVTPHIGGCTHEAMAATECMLARRFVEILRATEAGERMSATLEKQMAAFGKEVSK